MSLTEAERAEITRLFSGLIARIHDLPTSNTLVLWDIDEKLKTDRLTADDLRRIRELSARVTPPQ